MYSEFIIIDVIIIIITTTITITVTQFCFQGLRTPVLFKSQYTPETSLMGFLGSYFLLVGIL
jgi:hypothetical protein